MRKEAAEGHIKCGTGLYEAIAIIGTTGDLAIGHAISDKENRLERTAGVFAVDAIINYFINLIFFNKPIEHRKNPSENRNSNNGTGN